jgi:methionine biosynthesis protein MetW
VRNFLYSFKVFFRNLYFYPQMVSSGLSYDNYWQEKKKGALGKPNLFQLQRAQWIASKIEVNASVTDVGCGDGSVLFALREIKPIKATGLDISSDILSFLKENGIEAAHCDLNEKDAVNRIPVSDHIFLLEVLEHMPMSEDFLLKALGRVNKSVFVSIPNTGYIHHRLRLLFGKFPLQWRSHPSEHLRFWTVEDFDWWLRQIHLREKTEIHCYAGIPVLNKLFPKIFAQGIIAQIMK